MREKAVIKKVERYGKITRIWVETKKGLESVDVNTDKFEEATGLKKSKAENSVLLN